MKKVLIGFQGYINEIKDPGEDFDIYEGPDASIAWVDAPDNVNIYWTLEYSPSAGHMVWCERGLPFTNRSMARKVAYGEVGEQLGMLYDELHENGSISKDGAWYQHINYIKSVIERPEPEPEPKTMEELLVEWETAEPSPDVHPKLSSPELQCWVRYPGWKNYQR